MKCPYCKKQLLTDKQLEALMFYCRLDQDESAEIIGISQSSMSRRLAGAYKKFPFLKVVLADICRPNKTISYCDKGTSGVIRKF